MERIDFPSRTKKIATLSKREVRAVFRSYQFCMLSDEQIHQLYLRQEELRRRKLLRFRWPFRRIEWKGWRVLKDSILTTLIVGWPVGIFTGLVLVVLMPDHGGPWMLIPICFPGVFLGVLVYRSNGLLPHKS